MSQSVEPQRTLRPGMVRVSLADVRTALFYLAGFGWVAEGPGHRPDRPAAPAGPRFRPSPTRPEGNRKARRARAAAGRRANPTHKEY